MQTVRFILLAIAAPFVLLAIVFDWASHLMHCVVDRLAPKENRNGAH
jgi:hypothetical protein